MLSSASQTALAQMFLGTQLPHLSNVPIHYPAGTPPICSTYPTGVPTSSLCFAFPCDSSRQRYNRLRAPSTNGVNGNHAGTPTSGSVLSLTSCDLTVSDIDHLPAAYYRCCSRAQASMGPNKCGLEMESGSASSGCILL